MLYRVLKFFFRITIRIFFRKTYQHHPEFIPSSGPLLICANHPGAFLDPIVIASLIDRKVYFLAKGSVFKGKFANWFFPKLHMIPVYRAQDDPGQMHKNQETFSKCYEHLGNGGTILIFPEGVSLSERKLRPLKTGAARIALGAEEKYDFKLNVKVACVGLNYEDPHTFRRDVYIGFSEPISALDYAEKFRKDNFAAAGEMTEEIRKRLEEQMIITEDAEADELVKKIERLYKHDLMEFNNVERDKEAEFDLTKRIADAVKHYRQKEPQRVQRVSGEIKNYFTRLDELGLSDKVVKDGNANKRIGFHALMDLFYSILGFPFYVYGLIHNYLPFVSASWLSKNLLKAIEWRGAIGAASGMLFFFIWYSTLGFLSWHFFHKWGITVHPGWTAILYMISWPLTGMFAWFYYRRVYYISKRWLMVSLFFRRSAMVAELVLMRKNLIEEFEVIAEERRKILGPLR
ncbi:MAG TPA: lysophospholipid acyltransferase family protein [Bacteroidia bacterium]|jgi:1-acyl-sn-glycerol-3-phosphate acyltransferase|nr:lysophospholipid acyltransferase family protein [Bacteroidia bacterium]